MRELDRQVWADVQLTPAESYAWRKWAGFLPSEPRRKKKRKKKKLPRAPRPRCGPPCALQRQVPAVQGVPPVCASDPVGHSRRTVLNCAEDGRLVRCSFGWMLTRPLLCNDRDTVRQYRKPYWCHSCSSSKVDGLPSCRRGKSPWSCLFRKPLRLRSCSQSGGRCLCCAGRAMPVVVPRGAHGSDTAENFGGAAGAAPLRLWTSL